MPAEESELQLSQNEDNVCHKQEEEQNLNRD